MPERQSTPGGTTAEQDAEAPARGSAADAASSRPASPDEPTRPVSRGDAATVGLPRGVVSTPAVDRPAPRRPTARRRTARRPSGPGSRGRAAGAAPTGDPASAPTPPAGPAAGSTERAEARPASPSAPAPNGNAAAESRLPASPSRAEPPHSGRPPPAPGHPASASGQPAPASAQSASAPAARRPDAGSACSCVGPARLGCGSLRLRGGPGCARFRLGAARTPASSSHYCGGRGCLRVGPVRVRAGPPRSRFEPVPGRSAQPRRPSRDARQRLRLGDGVHTGQPVQRRPTTPRTTSRAPRSRRSSSSAPPFPTPRRPRSSACRRPRPCRSRPTPEAPTVAQPIGSAAAQADAPTVAQPTPPPPDDTDPGSDATPANPRRRRKLLLVAGGVVAALALLYGGDLAFSAPARCRGACTVAGVPVGGLACRRRRADGCAREIEPRTTRPVAVTVGEPRATVDPRHGGPDRRLAGHARPGRAPAAQPDHADRRRSSPRARSAWSRDRPRGAGRRAGRARPDRRPPAGRGQRSGSRASPRARSSRSPGQQLDVPAAAAVLTRDWVSGAPVALPLIRMAPDHRRPRTSPTAIEKVARPAVSAPVAVTGENGTSATLTPEEIAGRAHVPRRTRRRAWCREINLERDRPRRSSRSSPRRRRPAGTRRSTSPPAARSSSRRRTAAASTTRPRSRTCSRCSPAPAQRKMAAVYADQPAEADHRGAEQAGHHRGDRRVHHPRVRRRLRA